MFSHNVINALESETALFRRVRQVEATEAKLLSTTLGLSMVKMIGIQFGIEPATLRSGISWVEQGKWSARSGLIVCPGVFSRRIMRLKVHRFGCTMLHLRPRWWRLTADQSRTWLHHPGRGAYCEQSVCLFVCLSARASPKPQAHISPNKLHHVTCDCGSLLWRQRDMLSTSGFVCDVTFSCNAGNRTESKTTRMYRPVRQVAPYGWFGLGWEKRGSGGRW